MCNASTSRPEAANRSTHWEQPIVTCACRLRLARPRAWWPGSGANIALKLDQLDKKFETRLDQLDKKFETRLDRLETKLDRVTDIAEGCQQLSKVIVMSGATILFAAGLWKICALFTMNKVSHIWGLNMPTFMGGAGGVFAAMMGVLNGWCDNYFNESKGSKGNLVEAQAP